jgi:acyl dehydratase
MPLDPAGLGVVSDPRPVSWTAKDCAIYALGVGAGVEELAFTTDNTKDSPARMLPTMPVVLGADMGVLKALGGVDWVGVLHVEQGVELLAPLAVAGTGSARTRITQLWDKEKAAVVVTETEVRDETDTALFRTRCSLFVKGAGGWGGERGPSGGDDDPTDKPDDTVTYVTRGDQALLYRLSGDRNPLHSDPAFAARAGFPRPILHGLCTFGFAGRAVLHAAAGGDPERVRSFAARFAAVVFPGDTLHIDLWQNGSEVRFCARREDGTVVLSQGRASIAP